ncbi:hypothetical protein QYE76_064908 [Lolium multiflorum]|uniref:Transcription repressor n=1 Tax=Lolium multiflorum TaxID=4521 RepID=A0AAD8W8D4_LOLMU|nr:hypothetical protein QYE76_064908 [Lolium multiflorum]
MGRKSFSSIFSKPPASADEASPPWPWPSCRNPHTSSFRDEDERRPCSTAAVGRNPAGTAAARLIRGGAGEMYKTVNSVYQLDYLSADGSCFGDEEEHGVLELELDDDDDGFSTTTASEEWSEAVIRSLGRTSTDRFFVDPGPASNSIMALSPGKSSAAAAVTCEEAAAPSEPSSLVEESVAVAVDSEDPYGDFRASMEEMVAAHGLRGWDALEELLVWYLRINGKHNHALIVGAFVDLLVGLAGPPAEPSSSGAAPTATTTATTMTTSANSRSGGSTTSTSTSSSTCGCRGDATPTTTAPTEEQCGGRGDNASRSPASSDDHGRLDKEVEEDLVGDKAGDDRSISSTTN